MGLRIGVVIQQALYSRLYGGEHQLTGVGWYIVNLIRALSRLDSGHCFRLVYVSPTDRDGYALSLLGVKDHTDFDLVRLPLPVPVTYLGWHFLRLPKVEWAVGDLDLLHVPSIAVSVGSRCPQVVTVHDLTHVTFPEAYSRRARLFADHAVAEVRRSRSLVIVPSRHVGAELVDAGFRAEDIQVTYESGSLDSESLPDGDLVAELQALGVTLPYVLFVGASTRRKNLPALVSAYAQLPAALRDAHQLVIAGPRADDSERVRAAVAACGLADRVVMTGYLSKKQLALLHREATLFVMPSLSEGFGIPVVDSMSAGVPVAVSDAGSLSELVGDAGILFDPSSPTSIAEAMSRVLSDRSLQLTLSAKGLQRAAEFTWERTARETLAAYESAAERS